MRPATLSARFSWRPFLIFSFFSLLLTIGITSGCGSSGSSTATPKLTGNTSVTVALSSTANDQVTDFDVAVQTLTLTSQSGKTVTVLSSQHPSEFMHLNGSIEPLVTLSVPQDIYTSASMTLGGAVFVCTAQDVSGDALDFSNYSIVNQGPTVNLPAPITITGDAMALLLDMPVSSSALFSSCWTTPPFTGFSMTPTFNLTPFILASTPTNSMNGKLEGLEGQVASLGASASQFNIAVPEGQFGTRTLSVSAGSATVFQGVNNFSALTVGMFVNMDGALQPDGTLNATRIAVEDPSAINMLTGPLLQVASMDSLLMVYGRQEQGPLIPASNGSTYYFDTPYIDFSAAVFQVSGQFTNLQSLPFVPSFTAANMVAGQNVDISAQALSITGGVYTLANKVTLIPQTINGTVEGISTSGNFTVYTVSLANYDLFPQLAVQPGQTTLLTNPSEVQVYVDSNTQMLNTQGLGAGSALRFYGLVFNDNGTLRMDCGQINDGVALTTQSNSSGQLAAGQTRIVRHHGAGALPHATVITRSE